MGAEGPVCPSDSGRMVGSFLCHILKISVTIDMKLSVNVFFKPDGSVFLAKVRGHLWSKSFHYHQMNKLNFLRD